MQSADEVTIAVLADTLGLSERRAYDLVKAAVIPKARKGRYILQDAVRAYCTHLRDSAALRGGDDATTAARRREAEARAEKVELQNAKTRRELVPAADVERVWTGILRDVRARMLAVPSRVRSRIGHLTPADAAAIEAEVRDALQGAADASSS